MICKLSLLSSAFENKTNKTANRGGKNRYIVDNELYAIKSIIYKNTFRDF